MASDRTAKIPTMSGFNTAADIAQGAKLGDKRMQPTRPNGINRTDRNLRNANRHHANNVPTTSIPVNQNPAGYKRS